ncbi:MAG: ATP-binding protein [Bacillota bacterium]
MKILPASLLWRTLVAMVVALALSQAAAVYLMHELVSQPRIRLGVGLFVNHLKTINAALQTMNETQQDTFIARIVEREGIRIVRASGNERLRVADLPGLQHFRDRIRETLGPDAEVYVRPGGQALALWVRLPAGTREFYVAFPRGRIDRDQTALLIALGAVGAGIALLATFVILWRLNKPLEELARAAERLGKGADPPPVAEAGPSEIRALTRAFNQMKEDLQHAQHERATFLAGISHDLRTPLSRLRLDLEMLEGKVDAETQRGMIADLADMNAIIDQFIDFTRAEAAEPLSAVNLSELAKSCAERAARSGLDVKCDLAELPLVMMRPLAVQRLIDNLLANAARHAGGEVLVRTASSPGTVAVSVLDRGPGIPPEMVERLKQPFTRRDDSRSGSSGAGLGLAIASRVATVHGGRLDLLPREGGGLEARAVLPAAS